MKKRTIFISYLLLALLTAPQAALAQTGSGSNSDWVTVTTIRPGEKLAVRLKNCRKLSATVHDFLEKSCTVAESLRFFGGKEHDTRYDGVCTRRTADSNRRSRRRP